MLSSDLWAGAAPPLCRPQLDKATADAAEFKSGYDKLTADVVEQQFHLDKATADAAEFKAGYDKLAVDTVEQKAQLDKAAADAAEFKAGYDKLTADAVEQQAQVDAWQGGQTAGDKTRERAVVSAYMAATGRCVLASLALRHAVNPLPTLCSHPKQLNKATADAAEFKAGFDKALADNVEQKAEFDEKAEVGGGQGAGAEVTGTASWRGFPRPAAGCAQGLSGRSCVPCAASDDRTRRPAPTSRCPSGACTAARGGSRRGAAP